MSRASSRHVHAFSVQRTYYLTDVYLHFYARALRLADSAVSETTV
jgi:hypothetical protein